MSPGSGSPDHPPVHGRRRNRRAGCRRAACRRPRRPPARRTARAPSRRWCRPSCAGGRRAATSPGPPAGARATPAAARMSATSSPPGCRPSAPRRAICRPPLGRGEQKRRQQLGRGGVPELAVGRGARPCATSVRSAATRRAPAQVCAAGSGDHRLAGSPVVPAWVEAPDASPAAAPGQRVADQVGLHAGRQHRPLPAAGWPARPVPSSCRSGWVRSPPPTAPARPPAPTVPGGPDGGPGYRAPAARLGAGHHQGSDVAARCPAGAALGEPVPDRPTVPDSGGRQPGPASVAGPVAVRGRGAAPRRRRRNPPPAPASPPGATASSARIARRHRRRTRRSGPRRRRLRWRQPAPGRPTRDPARSPPHRRVGVHQLALRRAEQVLDQERSATDLPQRHAPAKLGKELGLGRREREQLAGAATSPGGWA